MQQLNNMKSVERIDLAVNMKATGKNIKRLMKEHGYTIKDMMVITGISTPQAIYKWLRGDSIPSTESQLILCKAMNLKNITDLLVIDGESFILAYRFNDRGQVQKYN